MHAGICAISDPDRWKFVDVSRPKTDELIVEACETAYHELGFRGWVLWHFYNDPIMSLSRLEKSIPQLKERVPEARTGLFTAGEPLPKDLNRLLVFDKIWLRNYRGRDTREIQKIHPLVLVDSASAALVGSLPPLAHGFFTSSASLSRSRRKLPPTPVYGMNICATLRFNP